MIALDVLIGVVVVAALLFLLRWWVLVRARGTVVCHLRVKGRSWRSGVARYAGSELHWIPFLGLGLRPRHALARRGLTVFTRRPPEAGDGPAGCWTIDCGTVSLAMTEDALTGFLSWLEAAPPSAHLDTV